MKKILVFILTLLMVLSMAGCGDPKEPEKPKLTEEQAIEFVKGLPQYVADLETYVAYMQTDPSMVNMNSMLEFVNIEPKDALVDPEAPLDSNNNGIGAIDVKTLQLRADEVFFKKYDIAEMFADYIEDGKIIGRVFIYVPNDDWKFETGERTFEVYEATDDYIVIKRYTPITQIYLVDNSTWDCSNESYYVVVLTDNGPRLYSWDSFTVGVRQPNLEFPVSAE